jgi:hypothetical protein
VPAAVYVLIGLLAGGLFGYLLGRLHSGRRASTSNSAESAAALGDIKNRLDILTDRVESLHIRLGPPKA